MIEKLNHFVLGLTRHQVDARADILAVGIGGDELESERVAAGGDTIGPGVVSTIDSAVGSTCLAIGTGSGVPSVTCVAVGVAALGVDPAPVGVEDDLSGRDCRTTRFRAFLVGKFGMRLGLVGADELAERDGNTSQGNKSSFREHLEARKWMARID